MVFNWCNSEKYGDIPSEDTEGTIDLQGEIDKTGGFNCVDPMVPSHAHYDR